MASLLTFSLHYCIKQMDTILLRVCSVMDHRKHRNVVRTSVTHLPNGLWTTCCSCHILMPTMIN